MISVPLVHILRTSPRYVGEAPCQTPHRIPNVGLKRHNLFEVITRKGGDRMEAGRNYWRRCVVAKSRRRRIFMVIHGHSRSFAFQEVSRRRRDQFMVIAAKLLVIAVSKINIYGNSRLFAVIRVPRSIAPQARPIYGNCCSIAGNCCFKKGQLQNIYGNSRLFAVIRVPRSIAPQARPIYGNCCSIAGNCCFKKGQLQNICVHSRAFAVIRVPRKRAPRPRGRGEAFLPVERRYCYEG